MKIVIILVICCLNLIEIINSKYFRAIFDDKLLEYELDKNVPSTNDFFNTEHFLFEQIDDDNVQMGGYLLSIKSMNPNLPLQITVKSFLYDKATWIECPLRLLVPNICSEFLNPHQFWYNVTKLWTSCPAHKGEKWLIEFHSMHVIFNLPPSISALPYKAFVLVTQGVPGIETLKYGFGLKGELVQV